MPTIDKIDATDRKILRALQRDGRMTNLDLAAAVNLSPSPCLRRIRILEANHLITGYSASVDAKAYGLPVEAMVQINIVRFESKMRDTPEVLACFMMTGQSDYLLRVVVSDLEDYERFVRERLHPIGGINSIDSSFVYGVVKRTNVFPDLHT